MLCTNNPYINDCMDELKKYEEHNINKIKNENFDEKYMHCIDN